VRDAHRRGSAWLTPIHARVLETLCPLVDSDTAHVAPAAPVRSGGRLKRIGTDPLLEPAPNGWAAHSSAPLRLRERGGRGEPHQLCTYPSLTSPASGGGDTRVRRRPTYRTGCQRNALRFCALRGVFQARCKSPRKVAARDSSRRKCTLRTRRVRPGPAGAVDRHGGHELALAHIPGAGDPGLVTKFAADPPACSLRSRSTHVGSRWRSSVFGHCPTARPPAGRARGARARDRRQHGRGLRANIASLVTARVAQSSPHRRTTIGRAIIRDITTANTPPP